MLSDQPAISRRSWLLISLSFSTVATLLLASIFINLTFEAAGATVSDHPELDKIRTKARQAGMEGFDEAETAHYLAIGDSNKKFREEALAVCESVHTDFFKYFAEKGFELTQPTEKLVVVALQGPKSYAMFEGGFVDDAIGGHFDLEENRLVMFDFRGIGANPKAPVAEQDNTLALVHETIHQLTFNTGLLDLKADIPLCIAEGLATYGETWRPKKKGQIGSTNARRLKGLEDARKQGAKWIPIATLIADDKLLNDEKTQQQAYAESWMLVNKLMKDPARLPKFRDYLAALRQKPDPAKRVETATTHLGDLEKLDRDVRSVR